MTVTLSSPNPIAGQALGNGSELTLLQIRAELRDRGFDALEPATLDRYINWAYFDIARKCRWYWEDSWIDATLEVGDFAVEVKAIGNLRELKEIYLVSTGQERRLERMDNEAFKRGWLPHDLATTSQRGQPTQYALFHESIYLIPPPEGTTTVRIYYSALVNPLTDEAHSPITPADMDEALVLGALKRCHVRSNEPGQAAAREADLTAVVSDMKSDETMRDGEFQERVEPDESWL